MEHEVIKDAVLEILEDCANEHSIIVNQLKAAERIAKYIQSLLKDKE